MSLPEVSTAFGGVSVESSISDPYFYVFHCPAHTLSYITALIVCVQVAVRYECFHTPVAGTDKCEYRVEKRIVEQCTTHFYGFLIGIEGIYIYHYEPGRRCEEFTTPADECAAWGYVGE